MERVASYTDIYIYSKELMNVFADVWRFLQILGRQYG